MESEKFTEVGVEERKTNQLQALVDSLKLEWMKRSFRVAQVINVWSHYECTSELLLNKSKQCLMSWAVHTKQTISLKSSDWTCPFVLKQLLEQCLYQQCVNLSMPIHGGYNPVFIPKQANLLFLYFSAIIAPLTYTRDQLASHRTLDQCCVTQIIMGLVRKRWKVFGSSSCFCI